MDFKISFGPWETIFSGTFRNHKVELVENPSGILLSFVYEGKDKFSGALVEPFKEFIGKGNIESFVESSNKKIRALIDSNSEDASLVIFEFDPIYVDFSSPSFVAEIDEVISKIYKENQRIVSVAKSAGITLEEIKDSGVKIVSLLEKPILIENILTKIKLMNLSRSVEQVGLNTKMNPDDLEIFSSLQLGLSLNEKIIEEDVDAFFSSVAFGGSLNERNRLLQVICEGLLLSNKILVVFDLFNSFTGLNNPSTDFDELKKFKVKVEPIGFPVKSFVVKKNFGISLSSVPAESFFGSLGMGDNSIRDKMSELVVNSKNIDEFENKIKSVVPSESFNEFEREKALRFVKLMSLRFEGLFIDTLPLNEFVKNWAGKIGKTNHINLSGLDDFSKKVLVSCSLKAINDFFKMKNSRELFVVIPEMHTILDNDELSKKIVSLLKELNSKGIGVMGSFEDKSYLSPELFDFFGTKLTVVKGNDIGVQPKGKKNYRVILRPTISQISIM